jgi:hypothetical protein
LEGLLTADFVKLLLLPLDLNFGCHSQITQKWHAGSTTDARKANAEKAQGKAVIIDNHGLLLNLRQYNRGTDS